MEPIISPLMIYLIGIVNPIKTALLALLGILVVYGLIYTAIYFAKEESPLYSHTLNEEIRISKQGHLKIVKGAWLASFVVFLLYGLVPDKETAIAMAVANMVTIDNIQSTNDFVKSNVQDYVNMIVEAVNKVK